MIVGLAVFVLPNRITQVMIGCGAAAAAVSLLILHADNTAAILVNTFVALCLVGSGLISVIALSRGGLPATAGLPVSGRVSSVALMTVLAGVLLLIPLLSLFVSGFSIVRADGTPVQLISEATIRSYGVGGGPLSDMARIFLEEISKPAGLLLILTGGLAFGYLILQTFLLERIARERMFVVLTLTFFSMLFWAFFEQAGSSLNNFTDRNVDRVAESQRVTASQIGQTIRLQPTQEQLGYQNGDTVFTLDQLTKLRSLPEHQGKPEFEIEWTVAADNTGMGLATRQEELAAATFQAVNAVCILIFGLIFTAFWAFLDTRGLEPSTPVKFALGLLQLSLGFAVFWYGAQQANERGMVAVSWLVLGYVLHTTGELCLSPVGLSMVTKLSPKILVSTVMGAWFLATAFSQYLAAIISQFTGVSGEGGDVIPVPSETVAVYGAVFGRIAVTAAVCGGVCLLLAPLLSRWMHADQPDEQDSPARNGA